ncbi:probable polygalacturonase At3g15720 [Neltuma alba]|uniref:probable polygalacturonase At3g15720 n=1 Tax=Neltuma alba TaxID=207710 RepID=UPI0010A2FF5D|nr:probable polygalacturonase At3g15720 [Prosopis alba]
MNLQGYFAIFLLLCFVASQANPTFDVLKYGASGNGQTDDSQAISFHACKGLTINMVNMINTPRGHVSLNGCNGSVVSNIHLRAPKDSPNTDGLGISGSSHVTIRDSTMEVGDDCLTIDGGSYMNISGIFCGPGHGISIGSLGIGGTYGAVEEVHVRNCTFIRSSNGARIKTWENHLQLVGKDVLHGVMEQNASNAADNLLNHPMGKH